MTSRKTVEELLGCCHFIKTQKSNEKEIRDCPFCHKEPKKFVNNGWCTTIRCFTCEIGLTAYHKDIDAWWNGTYEDDR